MYTPKWCVDLDILFLAVSILIYVDPAARKSSKKGSSGQNTDRFPVH